MTDEFHKLKHSLYKLALKERDRERARNKRYKKELSELRAAHVNVLIRISKLKDWCEMVIEFGDLTEDDKSIEMILKFCDDIVKQADENEE